MRLPSASPRFQASISSHLTSKRLLKLQLMCKPQHFSQVCKVRPATLLPSFATFPDQQAPGFVEQCRQALCPLLSTITVHHLRIEVNLVTHIPASPLPKVRDFTVFLPSAAMASNSLPAAALQIGPICIDRLSMLSARGESV